MTFHWFGDSWPYGDELDDRTLAYPHLVSQHFGVNCMVYAEKASGPSHLVWQTKNANINPGDKLFYGVSGLDRAFAFGSDNSIHHMTQGMALYPKWVKNPETLNFVNAWYKNFDSDITRQYAAANALDLCKALAIKHDATAYFYNIFSVAEIDTQLVENTDWIIHKAQCLAEEIVHVLDNEYYTIVLNDQPHLSEQDWTKQESMLKKYFRPNGNHPNYIGHQKLSKRLIDEITKR